jgi:hypothetical protein
VGNFARDRNYRANRRALLPLPAMLALLDQLPDLEKLLFYNFGEPFLHPGAVDFLRAVRSRRPDVTVQTSTNGLTLDRGKIEAIVREGLLDRIVLSIDGATEESYGRYRVGGDFLTAISALEQLARARRSRGGAPRPEIHWQYILFEWNDSDEEIALARATAARIGVELKFVLTHTPGASRLYRDGTAETARLFAGTDPFQALTCDARRDHLWKHGGASSGFRLARIEPEELEIAGGCGSRRSFGVRVSNTSGAPWVPGPGSRFRLGVRLRTATGRLLRELAGPDLPERCLLPGGTGTVAVDLLFPDGSGNYELFLDVVEEGICWFSERSSPPATVRLAVRGGGRGEAVLAASPPA